MGNEDDQYPEEEDPYFYEHLDSNSNSQAPLIDDQSYKSDMRTGPSGFL